MSQMRDFLGYLATVRGDLSNVTAPPFVLSPKSVTEIPTSWAERHELFLRPASEEDEARRALLILQNFLCSLKRQVYANSSSGSPEGSPTSSNSSLVSISSGSSNESAASANSQADTEKKSKGDGGAKKPLNAFLGEIFLGYFPAPASADSGSASGSTSSDQNDENDGSTRFISEQVSHHPPVTACHFYNKRHGISSSGYVAQETSFSAGLSAGGPAIRVRQRGHAIIHDDVHGESHLMTLPTMVVRGLLTGRPYPEFEGTCYISSSSGFLATITFGAKKDSSSSFFGLGGGSKKHSVYAEVVNLRDGGKTVFEADGQWSKRLTFRDSAASTSKESGKVIEEIDVDTVPLTECQTYKPLEQQSPWESRRAWRSVLQGIRENDMMTIQREKGRLEEAQRQMRAAERQTGSEWPRVFFRKEDEGETAHGKEYKILAGAIPDDKLRALEPEKTGGIWGFIGAKAAESLRAEGVYHQHLEPTGQVDL